MVMEVTAVGTRLGFVHASCGPSQVRDHRASRRAAIAAADSFKEAGTDMSAFLAFRSSPYPRAMVILSSPSPITYVHREGNESIAGLMPFLLASGMHVLAPPVADAVQPLDRGWAISFAPAAESLLVEYKGRPFYDGSASSLTPWHEAVDAEHECLLVYSHVGVNSDLLQGSMTPALDTLARRGLVCGTTASGVNIGPVVAESGGSGWYEPLTPLP